MPQSIALNNEAFANFIRVMSLPSGKRQQVFSNLLNEEKANVFKVQLALNFIKRPNLTKEQKDLILGSFSTVSADTYNKENPEIKTRSSKQAEELQAKALAIFPPNEAYEIFAGINGDKGSDIKLLKRYEEILSLPMNKRKKSIREMSPADRSDFWKAQMIYHLATAKLNQAQREFITGTIPFLTVNAFDFPASTEQPKNEETKNLDSLQPKAFELFSKEEMFAIFMGYGIHKEIPSTQNISDEIQQEEAIGSCDCNYWCGASSYCSTSSCRRSLFGCGWYGDQECSFVCR